MRSIRFTAFVAAGLLLGASFIGCSTNPSTGRSQLILLSQAQTNAMGEQAKGQMIAEFGGEVRSPQLRSYVQTVGNRIVAEVEPQYKSVNWEFFVLESQVVNAFALPGGKIFITRGLLSRFDNEAQVAGVLGHEVGHVTARHVDERISQAMAAEVGLSVLGSASDSAIILEGAGMLSQVTMLKWGRDQESESDELGMRYMSKAGYDPIGMQEVLEVLLAASAGQPREAEFLSTHPHPESRIEDIEAALKGRYGPTQGNPSYKKYEDRFQRDAAPFL